MTRRTSKVDQNLTKEETKPESSSHQGQNSNNEVLAHDDLCAICHALLYRPVTTKCNHTMCESCMNLWAEISINQQLAIVSLNEHSMTVHPSELEIKCPMCRTTSTATADPNREVWLRGQYPQTYHLRGVEERAAIENDFADSVDTLTMFIGNTHQLVKQDEDDDDESPNKHNWKFFVRASRHDLIEEVQIFLVRTD